MIRHYQAYGLSLKSAFPLPYTAHRNPLPADTELVMGSASFFTRTSRNAGLRPDEPRWFNHARLPNGSTWLRWSGLFEFLIAADGRRITCRALNGKSREAFQTYLISQVLSFALLKQGLEPLHATTVVINDRAAAFLGDSGYGKSSLAAACLQAGHQLLTDDVLVITETDRRFLAHPGPSRLKLFPEIAQSLLGAHVTGTPMNPQTTKLVIPLPRHLSRRSARPLGAIYVLNHPGKRPAPKRVTIRTLSHQRACLALIANTFNPVIVERDRLARQFDWAARLAAAVPVKSLSYPRDLALLPAVLQAVQADLDQ